MIDDTPYIIDIYIIDEVMRFHYTRVITERYLVEIFKVNFDFKNECK